jgi:hypothetical protein
MPSLQRLARIKYRLIRVTPYINAFQTAILIGFGWKWWYVLLFVGGVAAYFFEKRYGLAGEMNEAWKSSAEWQQFRREWDEFRQTH